MDLPCRSESKVIESFEETASEGSIEIQEETDKDWVAELNERFLATSSESSSDTNTPSTS